MALKYLCSVFTAGLLASACGGSAAPPPDPEEPAALSVTRWTERTELFAEYQPLVAGETSRFAIHLTRLDSFKPLGEGRVEVHLRGGGRAAEVFRVDGPSRPGIFGVDVKPASAGPRELVIVLRAATLEDEHHVGQVNVHANEGAARVAGADLTAEPAGISFLKEQQWSLEFGTAIVATRSLREAIRVPARVEARPGGAADLAAPIDGRLTRVLDVPLGTNVSRGQELARLLPSAAAPGDLPQLRRAQLEARSAFAHATRDRERAERLTAAGAAPQKRLDEARAAAEQAKARLDAAEAALAQHDAARSGGAAGTDVQFVVRSPIGGVIAHRDAVTGANVTAGTALFRVVDASQVHIIGQVPEAEAARARQVSAAEVELPGRGTRVPAGARAGIGKVLDPMSRTLPITFTFDNRAAGLLVGQTVFLHLLMEEAAAAPVVSADALVDDAGRPIVFVQIGGETFERRPVTVGARTGGLVQITEGLTAGERVVTRGAYLVRLASLSTSVPAHGHVH